MKKDPILTAPPQSPNGQYREEFQRFRQTIDNTSNNPANDKNTHRNTIYDRFLVHRFGTEKRDTLPDIAETAMAIRLKLLQQERPQYKKYIYDEFLLRLKESTDRPEFFWTYFETVFKKNREYLREYFSEAVQQFLNHLPESRRFTQSRRLIEYEPYIFSQTVMRRVVVEFEKAIPASRPGDEKLFKPLRQVTELKTNRKLTTTPDITVYLPTLPRLAKTPGQHYALFKWFETTAPGNRQRRDFIHGYIEAICRMTKENGNNGGEVLSHFLEYYFSRRFCPKRFGEGSEKDRRILIMTLSALPASLFNEIRKKLTDPDNDAQSNGENTPQNEMLTLLKAVRKERKKSFIHRFLRFFRKNE